jgi:hypothetical protein
MMDTNLNRSSSTDIRISDIKSLDWGEGKAEASLDLIAEYAWDHCQSSIDWYLNKKASKRIGAHLTRSGAIVLVVIASLIPLVGEIGPPNGSPWINPLWTSVLLVLAGGCIGLDRFFGFSTAYVRYLVAEQRLMAAAHEFQIDWELGKSLRAGRQPDPTSTVWRR